MFSVRSVQVGELELEQLLRLAKEREEEGMEKLEIVAALKALKL